MVKIGKQLVQPEHDKTNKMTCELSKNSDQDGHMPSLIRVFTVPLKKAQVLSYQKKYTADTDQTGWIPRLIRTITGHTCHFVGFVVLWLQLL